MKQFLEDRDESTLPIRTKYNTKAASLYKDKVKCSFNTHLNILHDIRLQRLPKCVSIQHNFYCRSLLNLKEVPGMKLTRLHRKCLFSHLVLCLPLRSLKLARLDQKHLRARMIHFIQILMIYHLAWRVVTLLMAALILIRIQGKPPFAD